jgi:hypothetical protein
MRAAKNLLWIGFAGFVAGALYLNWHEHPFRTNGPLAVVKALIWVAFLGFTGYSVYCSRRENLFSTIRKIATLYWGRQVGVDLYLGLLLTLFFVYLHEGSLLVTLIWLVPALVYGNLATLLYVAIHFDSIVARFAR